MPDYEEFIMAEFTTIECLIRVAVMAEMRAHASRNLGDEKAEDAYLTEADHALESARQLYILQHR